MKFIKIILLLFTFIYSFNLFAAEGDEEKKVVLASQVSADMHQIKQASIKYYRELEVWPTSIKELKESSFLPANFNEKTSWGALWKISVVNDELVITVDIPSADKLADAKADSDILDVSSRASKDLKSTKKNFAIGDQSVAQTAAIQEEQGKQAFDRGNIEKRAIIKALTITDDEIYLKAAELNAPLEREPINYIRITSTLKDGVQFATDSQDINFNTDVIFNKNIRANVYFDKDDTSFYLDPSNTSILNKLIISKIIDADNKKYYLDPSKVSQVRDVNAEQIFVTDLYVKKINGGTPVTIEELPNLAVTKMIAGDNIELTSKSGEKRQIGIITISVAENAKFTSVITTSTLTVGTDLTVGSNTEDIDNADFSLDGNDVYVAGDIATNNNLYVDTSVIIGSGGDSNTLTINDNSITHNNTLSLRPNSGTNGSFDLSSDDTGLTLDTTSAPILNIKATDQTVFQASDANSTGFVFQGIDDANILTIDTQNRRVSINTATSTADLNVGGTIQTNYLVIDAGDNANAIQLNRNSAGQWFNFDDGVNDFALYNTQGIPSAAVGENGSLNIDSAGGDLYIKKNNGWQKIANAATAFIRGGNRFGIDATLGTLDNHALTFITDNQNAITIGTDQTATFFGHIDLRGNDIRSVQNLSINRLEGVNGQAYSFNLNNLSDALTIKDADDLNYLVFDAANKQILVSQTVTLDNTRISGSNFDINGGAIDDVTIGATIPARSIVVGDLTLTGNTIDSSNNVIDFGTNELRTSGTLTVGNLNLSGSDLLDLGDLALRSLSPASSTSSLPININPGLTDAFVIREGTNDYLTIDTTVGSEAIRIDKATSFGANTVTGSVFVLTGGSIDNMVIGATTPAAGSFTTLSATALGQALDANNQEISNINIISGTIDVTAITATSIAVGSLTLSGSSITSTADAISFGDNDLITSGTLTVGNIDLSNSDLSNLGAIGVSSISANPSVNTIDINLTDNQANALNITEGANSYLNFDTTDGAELITVGQDINIGTHTISGSSFDIAGGTITGIASITGVDELTVGSLTFTGNTITDLAGGTITFDSSDVATTGTVTVGSLVVLGGSDISNLNNLSLNSIQHAGGTMTIQMQNNRAPALIIEDSVGANYLTFNSTTNNKFITVGQDINIGANTISGSSFNITGGTITGVAIADTAKLIVGDITIEDSDIISSSGAIDFGNNDLTTSGTLTVGSIDLSGSDLTMISDLSVATLSAANNTMVFELSNNQTSALDITQGNNSYLNFDTNNNLITVGENIIIMNGRRLTTNSVDINGGAIDDVTIGSNTPARILRVDDITINGNQITSSNSNEIDFNGTNLVGIGDLSVASLDANNISLTNLNNLSLNSISAVGNNINIGANGNTINIAGGALAVATNDDVSTSGNLSVTGDLSVSTITNSGAGISFGGEDLSGIDTLDAGATTVTSLVSTGDVTVMGDLTVSTITNGDSGISFDGENLADIGTLDATTITVTSLVITDLTVNTLSLTNNTITNNNNGISFDGEDLSNIGTLEAGATTVTSLVSTGDVTVTGDLIVGTITNGGSGINFGSENLSNIGTLDATIITATSLSITDLSVGTITNPNGSIINFVGENLTTTGTLNAGAATFTSLNLGTTGDITAVGNITASGDLKVRTDRLVVDNIGVAIGKNAATSALDVVGTVRVDGNGGNFINFMLGVSAVGSIQLNGTGGVDYMTTSDRRIKTNIKDTSIDALHILSNLRIVDYNFKKYPNADSITGFIAQEAQEVFSPMVANISDNLLGIATAKLIPILVKGVQIQQQQLDAFSDNINLNDDNINLSKNLNINNINIADTNGNLKANNLTVKKDIITNNKFSIKRIDNLKNLMSVNSSKIADKNAEGYMSVKDLYLSGRDEWASDPISKFNVFDSEPSFDKCLDSEQAGDIAVVKNTESLYVCMGNAGWKIMSMTE